MKTFVNIIPLSFKEQIEARQNLLEAGKGIDLEKLLKTWSGYREKMKKNSFSSEDLGKLVEYVLSSDFLLDYLNIDHPYRIDNINFRNLEDLQSEKYKIIPERIGVSAVTNLNIQNPKPEGYLLFKRKKYSDTLGQMMNE